WWAAGKRVSGDRSVRDWHAADDDTGRGNQPASLKMVNLVSKRPRPSGLFVGHRSALLQQHNIGVRQFKLPAVLARPPRKRFRAIKTHMRRIAWIMPATEINFVRQP